MKKEVGQTQTAGFQFGIRKTLALPGEALWEFLISAPGLACWLGNLNQELSLQQPFTTARGISGLLTVLTPYSHLRLRWKKPDWEHYSIVQLRVISKDGKSTIAIHQEKLTDAAQRAEMKVYWQSVMTAITTAVEQLHTN